VKSSSVTKPTTFPKSNGTQRKYLRERLEAVRYSRHVADPPEPTDVTAARRKVEAWEKSVRANRDKVSAVFDRARTKAKEAILFDSAENALKLVVAYEEMVEEQR
jgi:hypothetical protein